MDARNTGKITIDNIRWLLESIINVTDEHVLSFEKTRLLNLYDLAQELVIESNASNDELGSIRSEFFDIVDSHPKLRTAYMAMVSNDIIEIEAKGLASLSNLEKARPLTEIELQRKRSIEQALRVHREKLKIGLRKIAEE